MRGSSKIAMWVSAVLLGGVTASGAQAVEIRLVSAGAVRAVVSSLSESFTQETGHSVQATFGTMGVVRQKLAADPADVVIASDTVLDQLLQQGVIVTGTRADLARAGVGVGVRDGAPKPDISTPDAFKQTLLAAKSLVYVETRNGVSNLWNRPLLRPNQTCPRVNTATQRSSRPGAFPCSTIPDLLDRSNFWRRRADRMPPLRRSTMAPMQSIWD